MVPPILAARSFKPTTCLEGPGDGVTSVAVLLRYTIVANDEVTTPDIRLRQQGHDVRLLFQASTFVPMEHSRLR